MAEPQAYPNSGEQMGFYPKENTAYDLKEAAKKAQMTSNPSLLEDVLEWFDKQIKSSMSIQNINVTKTTIQGISTTTEASVQAQVLAYQLLNSLLEEKRAELERFIGESHDTEE